MAKTTIFSNSMADLLISAMAKQKTTGDPKSLPNKPEKKPAELSAQVVKSAIPQSAPQTLSQLRSSPKSTSARTITKPTNLIYNASIRTALQIEADFNDSHCSFNKRKGIIEGIRFHLDRYNTMKNPDAATRQKIVDYQHLIKEFTKKLHITLPLQSPRAATPITPQQNAVQAKPPSSQKNPGLSLGSKDQFDGLSSNAKPCDVVIGVDFGTACTKVVVRTPYHYNSASFLVPFGSHAHHSNQYLLPTHVGIENNTYYLPDSKKPAHYSNLKMKLIESLYGLNTEDDIDTSIAYLALLFRHIRTWFFSSQHEAYGEFQLYWQINVGVPSASAECDDLCKLYQKTVYTAWNLSLLNTPVSHPNVLKQRNLLYSDTLAEPDVQISVFPEVAAEVAGYTQSDFKREGLHLLVDIGAGTLDVCGFNVYSANGDNLLPLFSTSVEPLGVRLLHDARRKAVEKCMSDKIDSLMPDPATPLTCDLAAYAPEHSVCVSAVLHSDSAFIKTCNQQIKRVVHHLRTSMDPNSNCWKDQLPVFLCGGGKALAQYQDLIETLSDWMRSNAGGSRARLIDLPCPTQLKGNVRDEDYHRFAVAWGLSHPSDDIDKVITNVQPITNVSNHNIETPWYMRRGDYSLDDD